MKLRDLFLNHVDGITADDILADLSLYGYRIVTPKGLESARDVIKQAFESEFDDTCSGDAFAVKCVTILHEEGFTVLAPGEMDRETLEAAAKVASWAHMVPPDGGSPTEDECRVAENAAAAIRALGGGESE